MRKKGTQPFQPRLYFIGGHSTGKTTLARYFAESLKIPLITEVARGVLSEMEVPIAALRTDLRLVAEYQRRVFRRQMDAERAQPGGFVSDRAFDNLAYAAEHTVILPELTGMGGFTEYMQSMSRGLVFFIRPCKDLLESDGVRETPVWDGLLRIDGMVKLLLEQFQVPYLPISTSSMQERVRTVEFVLRLCR